MTDIEKARQLFRDAGLAFPTIPEELAVQLKELDRWLFSTRPLERSPYNLQHYVREVDETEVKDYALLSHSGHGVNSYAIQYYVVRGSLRLFLHIGWGGGYMDAEASACTIRDCFALADRLVLAAQSAGKFQAGERLTVVGSDFYGSYWLPPEENLRREAKSRDGPLDVLTQALDWLTGRRERQE